MPGDDLPPLDSRRINGINRQRQKAIADDAGKLLILARELNANSAGKTDAERIHMAAEIERLAKRVREKMSYAAGTSPAVPEYILVSP